MKNSLLSYLFSGLALALGAVGVSPSSFAQTEAWRQFREEGDQRLASRRSTAEDSYVAALKAAEQFGLGDPRVAACLNSLALLYYAQRRFDLAERSLERRFDLAEPLYWRAVRILESGLGPFHPELATLLENLAELQQSCLRTSLSGSRSRPWGATDAVPLGVQAYCPQLGLLPSRAIRELNQKSVWPHASTARPRTPTWRHSRRRSSLDWGILASPPV